MRTLKPQSNGPPYSNTVTGDWYIWYSEDGPGRGQGSRIRSLRILFFEGYVRTLTYFILAYAYPRAMPKSHHSMWHYNYLCTQTAESRAERLLLLLLLLLLAGTANEVTLQP